MTTRDSTGQPSAGPILTDPISTDPVPANPVPTNPVPAGPIPSSLAEVAASVPAAPVRGSSTDALPEHRATGAVQAGQADTGQIPGRQLELLSLAALARTLHLQGDERLAGVAEQYLGLALYRFRLIFRQRPPVKQGLLGDPIKLSFKQFALFSNSFK